MTWSSLVTHSQYSLLQSTLAIKPLVQRAKALGMPALALTDSGNLFGAIEFYKAAKEAGIQPIIGAQLYLSWTHRQDKSRPPDRPVYSSLVLLAKNAQGYKNLCKLTTAGYFEGFYYVPRIDESLLFEHAQGLICISGSVDSYHGYLGRSRSQAELTQAVERFAAVFGEDFVLQVQRMEMSPQELENDGMTHEPWLLDKYAEFITRSKKTEEAVIEVGKRQGIPLVATHEAFYLERQDWQAHEVLLNVQSGESCRIWQRDSQGEVISHRGNPKRDTLPSHAFYFSPPEEMVLRMSDLQDAVAHTQTLVARCTFEIDFKSKHYPTFSVPEDFLVESNGKEAVAHYLKTSCLQALQSRYSDKVLETLQPLYPTVEARRLVQERLDMELEVIISKGFADYLLIVADFIGWAKKQGIPVGPGRGSGAGSIVCYLLGITDIEPLRFHLFFERFINPERVSDPDIDVDICMDRRGEVINYMLHKYGRDNVAQIITFGTMKAKMSIKDVGRVLGIPLAKVNQLCKLLPDDLNLTLDDARTDVQVQELIEQDPTIAELMTMATKLEGCVRNTGIHAAGLIISADPLVEHIPLFSAKDNPMAVTQYAMKPVESVGMLKIDFLGLKTLTSIQKCVNALAQKGISIDWRTLPLDDAPTFALLNKGKTLGVFQMESGGMQDLARQLHLDSFEEMIAVVSLYRPGPMDMIPSFINRKHGREPIEYDHPLLQSILAETYGIMVYQEQVMQIASTLAGFTLAEGDVLRRAMGKKDAQEMSRQQSKFISGAQARGIDPELAEAIFEKMAKFAAYGFNKSHAAAYAYIAYVTAYLKANHPGEWMAALMTCDAHDLSKVAKFIAHAHVLQQKILPPDINESDGEFRATTQGIRFALTAIKGLGSGVVAHIQEKRPPGGFQDLGHFLRCCDAKKLGKKSVELLIDAGALDFIGATRCSLHQQLEEVLPIVIKQQAEKSKGIFSLFDHLPDPPLKKELMVRSKLDILLKEKELLGFFITGNPMQLYQLGIAKLGCLTLEEIATLTSSAVVRIAFMIEQVVVKVSHKTQKKFAILMISEGQERLEMPIWADLFERYAPLLQEGRLLAAVCIVDVEGGSKLTARWLADLTQLTDRDYVECDEAYDKARQQLQAPKKSFKPPSLGITQGSNMTTREVHLTLMLDQVRLSHLLELKKLLGIHPGSDRLHLRFVATGVRERLLKLDSSRGITWSQQLEQALIHLLPGISVDKILATDKPKAVK